MRPDPTTDAPHNADRRTAGLTVREVARRYRVSPDKVRAWIGRGELAAINTADVACSKPRWVVTAESLAAFEQKRAGGPPPKPARRTRKPGLVDYYPQRGPKCREPRRWTRLSTGDGPGDSAAGTDGRYIMTATSDGGKPQIGNDHPDATPPAADADGARDAAAADVGTSEETLSVTELQGGAKAN